MNQPASMTFCEMHRISGCDECPNKRPCPNSGKYPKPDFDYNPDTDYDPNLDSMRTTSEPW